MASLKDLLVRGSARFASKVYASDQIISNVSQGTAPFAVDSSTLVTNLNADLVDGLHASAFYQKSEADGRFVLKSGDTMSGKLSIECNKTWPDAPIITKNTSNISWITAGNFLAPNMSSGQYDSIMIGHDTSNTNNAAHFSFYYAGDSSTNNRLALAFLNNVDLFVVKADGNVGIGTSSPTSKLHVKKSSSTTPLLQLENTTDGSWNRGIDVLYPNLSAGNWSNMLVAGKAISKNNAGTISFYYNDNQNGDNKIGLGFINNDNLFTLTANGVFRSIYPADPTSGAIIGKILTYNPSPYGIIIKSFGSGTHSLQVKRESNNTEFFPLALQPDGSNVGIGNVNPSYTLDVSGQIRGTRFRSSSSGTVFYDYENYDVINTGSNYLDIGFGTSQQGKDLYLEGTNIYFRVNTNNNRVAAIDSSGNVGIGTATPSYKLDVVDNKSNGSPILRVTNNNSGDSTWGIMARFPEQPIDYRSYAFLFGKATSKNNMGDIGFMYKGDQSSDNTITMGFYSNDNIIGIKANAAVGINTINPQYRLDIYTTSDNGIRIYNTAATKGVSLKVGDNTPYISFAGASFDIVYNSTNCGEWSNNRYFTVLSGGNIGVNDSNPAYKLTVNGTSYLKGVRIGRDFSISNRATIRLDANGDAPQDIIFSDTAAANETSWTGAHWVISSRQASENYVFGIWTGSGNPNHQAEDPGLIIHPTYRNVKIGESNGSFATDRGYKLWVNGDIFGNTGFIHGFTPASGLVKNDYVLLAGGGYKLVDDFLYRLRRVNLNISHSNNGMIPPAILELKNAGYPLYDDPEFASGTNSCNIYNWQSGTVSITREQAGDHGNSSGYQLKIVTNGTAGPGAGGFVQSIDCRANAVFVQIFRAKIPVGWSVYPAANSEGAGATDTFITSQEGTGKWEWYARVIYCGTSGSFSNCGYLYLSGSSNTSVTWYVSYCNAIDITKANYDGLRTKYSDDTDTLDGYHSSAFMKRDSDTFWGTHTYTGSSHIFETTSSDTLTVFKHTGSGTPVPFRVSESSSTNVDSDSYGVLQIERLNTSNGWNDSGASLYFNLKNNNGSSDEVAGISGINTEGGKLVFRRRGRTEMGTMDSTGLSITGGYSGTSISLTNSSRQFITFNQTTTSEAGNGPWMIFQLNGINKLGIGWNNTAGAFFETYDGGTYALLSKGTSLTFNGWTLLHSNNYTTYTNQYFKKAGDTISSNGYIRWADASLELAVYNSRLSLATTGQSTAMGMNVGSLLVSSAWADSSKVPTNGIYTKGYISGIGFKLGNGFHIENRAGLRLNSRSTAYPSDILFGHKNGDSDPYDSWTNVYWAISARGSGDDYRLSIWRGSALTAEQEFVAFTKELNVGIGTLTPSYKLDVDSSVGNGSPILRVTNNSAANSTWGIISRFPNQPTSYRSFPFLFGVKTGLNNMGDIGFKYVADSSTNNTITIGFYSNDDLVGIKANGNFGIGTINPSYKLHVTGKGWFDDGTGGKAVAINSSSSDVGYEVYQNSSRVTVFGYYSGGSYMYNGVYGGNVHLNNSGYFVTPSRLSVGAGDSPSYYLHVNGSVGCGDIYGNGIRLGRNSVGTRSVLLLNSDAGTPADIVFRSGTYTNSTWGDWSLSSRGNEGGSNNSFYISRGGQNNGTSSEACIMCFHHNGKVLVGQQTFGQTPTYQFQVTGDIYSSTNMYATHYYETSDIRYKTELLPISASLSNIANIPIFEFSWKDDNTHSRHYGTSAQEVQKILPNLVTSSGEDYHLTLDYGVLGTVAGITAAREIMKLKEEIRQLKQKLGITE